MTCKVCKKAYDRKDDMRYGEPTHDPDWIPSDGRCWACFMNLLHGIYGNALEPVFAVTEYIYF